MSSEQPQRPISTIQGDRLCVSCAYNLRGQPVQKEEHYGLFIARCPECGTPAAIQEYPMLGRWPGRIRVLLALCYISTLLVVLVGTCIAFAGLSSATPESATAELAEEIAEAWLDYEFAEHQAGRDAIAANGISPWVRYISRDDEGRLIDNDGRIIQGDYWTIIGPTWWEDTGRDEVMWPMSKRIRRSLDISRDMVVFDLLVAFSLGVFWAVLLIATRRRVLACLGFVPIAVTVFFAWLFAGDYAATSGGIFASTAAESGMLWSGFMVTGVLWIVASTLGLVFGRPIARLGVRALLPPTMRGAVAELWFTDGKPLPTGTRAPRTLYPEAAHKER